MNKIAIAIAVFLLFMITAVITTAVTYAMVYGLIWFIGSSFGLPDRYSWVPMVGTGAVFVIGLLTAIRNRIPDITRLDWDSGTTQDCPSAIRWYRKGGRLWNMNPLGPLSVASIGAIGGAVLCAGPSLAVSAFISAIEELKKGSQRSVAGYVASRRP